MQQTSLLSFFGVAYKKRSIHGKSDYGWLPIEPKARYWQYMLCDYWPNAPLPWTLSDCDEEGAPGEATTSEPPRKRLRRA